MAYQAEIVLLVRRAQGGSREAFDAITQAYTDQVTSFVRSTLRTQLRGTTEVDDLVQETFLGAFRAIDQFRGDHEIAFRAWLLTIARHVVQGQGRRLAAKKAVLARAVPLKEMTLGDGSSAAGPAACLAAGGTTPSQDLRRNERFDRLKNALSELPPDYREVIILARLKGLPLKEVAELMGRSPKAVSLLLWRAIQNLKEDFGETESLSLPHRSIEEEGK